MKKECLFVDVFTDTPFTGNQLAVFADTRGITGEMMQKLANEINYSETTFIAPSSDGSADFDMRIFTPARELPFAGHPTLGTAFCIMELLDVWHEPQDILRLKTKVGAIPLRTENGAIWMTQNEPEFFDTYTNLQEIAELVGLSTEDLDVTLPVEEVSTGNKMLIIPVKTLDAMRRAEGHATNMKRFFAQRGVGPYLFTCETTEPSADVHTRFFGPHLGILEDPATGSAAGPLAGYLLKHGVFGNSFDIINEQGVEMGRPSKILMRGDKRANTYTVEIGGMCVYVGKGLFEIHE
jgi:trans-2,3-dihydro-3-hydroxyanthranilate isomerase